MPRPCFIANWKMNKTLSSARDYLDILQKRLSKPALQNGEVILAPPYTGLVSLHEGIGRLSLEVQMAAQNLYFEAEGAYTGEVSATMIRETGCQYVIVGHSERRVHFGEKDEEIARKVAAAQIAGLMPILCVGENEQQRQEGKTLSVIKHQVKKGFYLGLSHGHASQNGPPDLSECIIAYEPVWAIGTGKTPTPHEAEQVHCEIVAYLKSEGISPQEMPRLLYGGSVNERNIAAFMKERHIDGVLAGGASLSADTFVKMIELGLDAKGVLCTY